MKVEALGPLLVDGQRISRRERVLDWVVGRVADPAFNQRTFPPTGPLMRVCDGTNAASLSVNESPTRFRPHRLWVPDAAEMAAADVCRV